MLIGRDDGGQPQLSHHGDARAIREGEVLVTDSRKVAYTDNSQALYVTLREMIDAKEQELKKRKRS